MSHASARLECARCGRPEVACYCAHVTPISTRTRVVVLQHPRERDKAVGTARIAASCLTSAEIFVGVDFSTQPRVCGLLADPRSPAVLLYPGPDARDVRAEHPGEPVTLVVIDGTWHQARSLMRRNPQLSQLPRYAFQPARPSEYRIRREPRADYVSTVEALAITLAALEGDGRSFEQLLAPFRAMVSVQVAFASRSARGRHRSQRRGSGQARARLPDLLLEPELLCVTGEANAWPHDRALRRPPYPHELVHWLAARARCADTAPVAAKFEAVIAARAPLSRSPVNHARLSAEQLQAGRPLHAFVADWEGFARRDDVIVCWGHYATNLLRREGVILPERTIDLRKVAGDFLKSRPGSLEALIEARALPFEPLGHGRGGERLGMLVAVTRWLAHEAQRERVEAHDSA